MNTWHDFKKSTVTKDTEARFSKIVEDKLLHVDKINVSKVLGELETFESDILKSLQNGDKTYVTPASVKELGAYTYPMRIQGVRGIIAWNYIYPDMEIQLPAKIDIIKLTLTTDKEFERLKELSPDIYARVEKYIINNSNKEIRDKGLEILAIPRSVDKIPDWVIPFIDYETIMTNVSSKFYSVIESLGTEIISGTSTKDYFSNILNI